jgi:hypothetical protein
MHTLGAADRGTLNAYNVLACEMNQVMSELHKVQE